MFGKAAKADYRPDIEGLRAIAAVLVATYHIWLDRVSGGVDVFFVVSGFLMTTTLLKQVERTGWPRPLGYLGRLARRLFPLAAVVLLATLLVSLILFRGGGVELDEVVASALYYENWHLAFDAVDYLAQNESHSAVQQFWAMSVQGQFYLIWLALFAIVGTAVFAAVRRGADRAAAARRATLAILGVVVAASFALSVWHTAADQVFAYYDTFDRVWEFGAGGLVALVAARFRAPNWVRQAMSWLGIAALVACGLVLNVQAAFPGYAALWPVGAAVLILLSGAGAGVRSVNWLLRQRPLVWIGGFSYALYLWHWPLVAFTREWLREPTLGPKAGIAVLAASLVLAWATTRLIERPVLRWGASAERAADRFRAEGDARGLRSARTRVAVSQLAPVAAVAVIALVAGTLEARQDSGNATQTAWVGQVVQTELAGGYAAGTAPCVGALALAPSGCTPVPPEHATVLPAGEPLDDRGRMYTHACSSNDGPIRECTAGPMGADVRIALIGNSHAAMWFPALEAAAQQRGWEVHSFYKSSCVFASVPNEGRASTQQGCDDYYHGIQSLLAAEGPFDLVITSYESFDDVWSAPDGTVSAQAAQTAFREAWQPLLDRGSRIVIIHDTPHATQDALDCRDRSPAFLDATACSVPRSSALATPDLMVAATAGVPGAVSLDFSDSFCTATRCPLIVGGIKVYQDTSSHFTASYSLTLAPVLAEQLDRVLAAGQ